MVRKLVMLVVLTFGLLAMPAVAGTIYTCDTPVSKNGPGGKKTHFQACIAEIPEGDVGQMVFVKSRGGDSIAAGMIVNRQGKFANIVLSVIHSAVKSGYSVLVGEADDPTDLTAITSSM